MTLLAIAAPTSDTPAILVLCFAMTIGLFWYIFQAPAVAVEAPEKTRLAFLRERKETIYDNLRDLNFEFKAGKFPPADYQQMRHALEDEAAVLLAEIESLEGRSTGGLAPSPQRQSASPAGRGAKR